MKHRCSRNLKGANVCGVQCNSGVVVRRRSVKKVSLKILQNSQESTWFRVSFLIKLACSFIKKETLAQEFFCEFCEIFKKTFFYRTPLVAASGNQTTSFQKRAHGDCLRYSPVNIDFYYVDFLALENYFFFGLRKILKSSYKILIRL